MEVVVQRRFYMTHQTLISLVVLSGLASAQPLRDTDGSPHQTRLVSVDAQVRLEVLDWGGSGRALVLLAGSGNTAHVFDDFGPELTKYCHVYGITRRGFGGSDRPRSGYDDQRLADDVLPVLRTLSIDRPVVAGHSMAGGELTTLGNQHSDLLAGLVYLDALGDPRDWPATDPAYRELLNQLPEIRRGPPVFDRSSFSAYRASQLRNEHFAFPESELRQLYAANPDGSVGHYKASDSAIDAAVGAGQKKRDYSHITVPVLAMFEYPRVYQPLSDSGAPQIDTDAQHVAREAYVRATAAYVDRWVNNLKSGVANARIVDLPRAGHFVFLSREDDVISEIRKFFATIP